MSCSKNIKIMYKTLYDTIKCYLKYNDVGTQEYYLDFS